MATDIDLRETPPEDHRDRIFDALERAETDETLDIVAGEDLDPQLVRYQLEHDRDLTWEYADPDAEPRELAVTVNAPLGDGALGSIDVRDLKPQRRHEALLEIFDTLGAGEGFVLVNDHDPKPLYHELRSMHGDVVDWEYAKKGPDEWRVEIAKTGESDAPETDIVTRYDVREIPKQERHPTIHHRYGMIPAGGTLELIAPHEPRPLHQEFRQQYGDSFTWEVVESEPGRCRVRITKDERRETDDEAGGDDGTAPSTDDGGVDVTEELDVRDLPPAQRHEKIFAAYDELDGGNGFVLVNDHDPKPLYHQFEAEAGPEFRWAYRKQEPGEFRVLIGKADTGSEATGDPEAPF